ncbi:MAG TPA: hypothetical protein VGZ02_06900 [Candidatus Baltobacteraceae bacterium]|jgi:hypothetical protein|nr:hypothetical protein [Candidatus Baltobacteraceae bacterium]
MRRVWAAIALVFCIPQPVHAAQAVPAVVITAQQIALYSDRGVMIADGGVTLRTAGLRIDATRAAYDLRANRLTAAGDVSVTQGNASESGTGYVYDFGTKSGTFSPGATVPQYSTSDAAVVAQQAELHPAQSITFTNGQARAGAQFTPVASYTYAIPSPNAKDFGYSPVPSAALEWPMLLGSTANAYEFARVRYDRYNGGPGAGVEEHYARTGRGYVALGETMDVNGGRLDLAAYQKLNDDLSQSFTGSTLFGVRAFRYSLTSSGARGYTSLSFSQYNWQRSDDLFVQGNQRPVGRIASFRLQADLGHDVHPGDWPVAQDLRLTPGLHVDTSTLHIRAAALSGSFDVGESFYDYGRATLASTASFWASLPMSAHVLWNAGAAFSHDAPPFPSTYRTYSIGLTWKANDSFNLVSSLQYAHDFGQYFGTGRPEFTGALDVRVRRKNGTGIEVGTIVPFGGVGNFSRQAVLNFRFFK